MTGDFSDQNIYYDKYAHNFVDERVITKYQIEPKGKATDYTFLWEESGKIYFSDHTGENLPQSSNVSAHILKVTNSASSVEEYFNKRELKGIVEHILDKSAYVIFFEGDTEIERKVKLKRLRKIGADFEGAKIKLFIIDNDEKVISSIHLDNSRDEEIENLDWSFYSKLLAKAKKDPSLIDA
jgi:uncharacterized protein (UPF0128 family)